MSADEIATMLDVLADKLSEGAARAGEYRVTRPVLNGDQAITVVIMALREIAEMVSQS